VRIEPGNFAVPLEKSTGAIAGQNRLEYNELSLIWEPGGRKD
jgi:hypothetical protein